MMKNISFLFVLALSFFCSKALSQVDSASSVIVHQDPRIEMLINKQIEINEITTRNARRHAPGFRILVLKTNDRNTVTEAKTKVYQRYPELKAYTMYQAPFFRLKVGNFRERSEAETYLRDIQRLFSGGVYIVPDTIEVRPEEQNP